MVSGIHIKYKWFLNHSIWPIDGTLTDTATTGQSEPESNGNKGVNSTLPAFPELEPHHQTQFNVMPRTPIFFWEVSNTSVENTTSVQLAHPSVMDEGMHPPLP